MRILHTSDWHIGRWLGDYSLLEDQRFLLGQMLEWIQREKVDVLLISGDLYDKRVPSAQAVKLLDETLYHLVGELKIKVLAIGGNHDSPERLSFANRLYRESGFYMESSYNGTVPVVTLQDEFGPVSFHLLPYTDPYMLRQIYGISSPVDETKLFAQTVERVLAGVNPSQRNILLAHGFFGWKLWEEEADNSLTLSDSEVSVGGAQLLDLSPLAVFDYIALGHLHAPQKVGRETVRYSGSPLKYSVSEAGQKKSMVLLDCLEKGKLSLSFPTFSPLRDVRVIEGSVEQLSQYQQEENTQDYVFAQLTDDHMISNAMSRIKSVYPYALGLKLKGALTSTELQLRGVRQREEKGEEALFFDFYRAVLEQDPSPEELDLIRQVMRQVKTDQNLDEGEVAQQ